MARALDEPDALYGLLAETVTISADRNIFTFALRPEARWHDGTPLTAEDVAFSYLIFKEKGHPLLALPLSDLTSAEAVDPRNVRLTFSGKQSSRADPDGRSTFPIVSKAWFSEHPFDSSAACRAARLRSLQGRPRRRRPDHRVRARRRLLGPRPAGEPRAQQFRRHPHRCLSRAPGGLRSLQEGRRHLPPGIHLARSGRPATTSPR